MSSELPADGEAGVSEEFDGEQSESEEFDVSEYDVDAPVDADETDPTSNPAACDDPAERGTEPTACAYTDYSPGGKDPEDLPATGEGATGVEADVWDALYEVEDPEMPVSIVDLGLLYGVSVTDEGHADVAMTLTYTGCPARNMLTDEVEEAVAGVEGVESVDFRLVWSPEWSIEMVTEDGKDDLREFGLSV